MNKEKFIEYLMTTPKIRSRATAAAIASKAQTIEELFGKSLEELTCTDSTMQDALISFQTVMRERGRLDNYQNALHHYYKMLNGHEYPPLAKREGGLNGHECDAGVKKRRRSHNWDFFTGRNWAELILAQPQFAEFCDWKKLEGSDWAKLLSRMPQFSKHCDWAKLEGSDWNSLLKVQPLFADFCDWKKLSGEDWEDLLEDRPELATNAKEEDWEKLSGSNWVYLLRRQPGFVQQCQGRWNRLDGKDWTRLLDDMPWLQGFCNWNSLDGKQWVTLILDHSYFANRCE